MPKFHKYPVLEIAEKAVKNVLKNGENFNNIHYHIVDELLLEMIRIQNKKRGELLHDIDKYISHDPWFYGSEDSAYLCFCKKIKYFPKSCIHISKVPCKYTKDVVCIRIENLSISTHEKGKCPYTKYVLEEEKE